MAAQEHVDDLLNKPLDLRYCRGLNSKVQQFNKEAEKHQKGQESNPFSDRFKGTRNTKYDGEYGRPVAGSKTDLRGKAAHNHVSKEILELCQIIHDNGEPVQEIPGDQRMVITFGELFQIYTHISNKVVGLLLRGRKQKLLDFEGETLFQRRDDDVPVVLLLPIQEIKQKFHEANVC